MSVNLCVDWGNTRVKAAVYNSDQQVEARNFSAAEAPEAINELINSYHPAKGIMCAVTNHTSEAEQVMNDKLKAFIKLTNSTRVPIMNAYSSPDTLGADRLGLAVGAHMLNPDKNNLVISIGTCVTYNFVQKNKTFRGGAISPGLHMRLKAMHAFTDRLPEVPLEGELLLLGYDTATCMRSGAVFGIAAEIDGMITEFTSQYPDFNAILTGGDLPFFATKVKSKIFADPDLLLKGLNLILNYNVPHIR
ncbi:type III pantothenate kinase [Polluticoccus soli]|uniref:type III pantothenate kinase n=1 Tax=Polluticoccus soli TaxID=3034150 RepID=UPI0023E26A94|nr:type III pantothenate kinase [Flavipsychrobacter sp. JY13-12]